MNAMAKEIMTWKEVTSLSTDELKVLVLMGISNKTSLVHGCDNMIRVNCHGNRSVFELKSACDSLVQRGILTKTGREDLGFGRYDHTALSINTLKKYTSIKQYIWACR